MKHMYPDILALSEDQPIWYDMDGVPRYAQFSPELCPHVYARWTVLMQIACQECGRKFSVEMHGDIFGRRPTRWGELHYGDPPRHGLPCVAGDTMNCDDLLLLEVWLKPSTGEWERHEEHEGPMDLASYPTFGT